MKEAGEAERNMSAPSGGKGREEGEERGRERVPVRTHTGSNVKGMKCSAQHVFRFTIFLPQMKCLSVYIRCNIVDYVRQITLLRWNEKNNASTNRRRKCSSM